jgi:hypothetical protein
MLKELFLFPFIAPVVAGLGCLRFLVSTTQVGVE